ncbi:telomere repeat-binding protein 5-like [Lycium ferocissimum]|uniref:telomere repeat-binding protein 5-like n=1 Tax=Lycium ferocissimum TaxID=112874 RepID=UPI002815B58B|nr:telomere repeat-binding protein 5-like [Lycium ferocissimum]XP_059300540.1 telomere repeat-binding protein 5-like [Lycium ferocissimum]
MVLRKRLDYGFNGYQVPPIPRATRSARRRGIIRGKADGDGSCPFDLLATVAGKLLGEGEKEQVAIVKDEKVKEHEDRSLKEKNYTEGCYEPGFIISELVSQAPVVNRSLSELPHAQNDTISGPASVTMSSDCSEKFPFAKKFVNGESSEENGNLSSKTEQEASGCGVFSSCTLDTENDKQIKIELLSNAKVSTNKGASEFPDVWNKKPSTLVTSDESVKLSLSTYPAPCRSFPVIRNDVNLANKDDDENSGCTQPSTPNKASGSAPRVRDWPIKKLLASKYWEENLKSDHEGHANSGSGKTMHVYHNRNIGYKHQRSQRDFPFKKRKLFKCGSFSNSDGEMSIDGGINSFPTNDLHGNASSSSKASSGGCAAAGTSVFNGGRASFRPDDSHGERLRSSVKFRIKSFRVPELFVEIPENATIGSLKRTVMEAVTAILGGGLRIGVVFQGKKVRDDNKTLLQTGISHDYKLDALGFSLEPNPVQASQPLGPDCRSCVLPYDTPRPLTRCQSPATVVHTGIQQGRSDDHTGTSLSNFLESDHESAPSSHYTALEKISANSRALVPATAVNAEALSVVPLRKPKRSESTQRRIRRPFSVAEVEALVQAVEKLGTGRWRDVKLRAFDNAKHRTYVDLKDKWKTLVHTARISPQQRRGEPVPQELLDRVLTAHAYWSQQQAKQQMKQPSETYLLL